MKKILAFVLSVALLITSFVIPSFGAEAREYAINDEQMGLLYALGISSAKSPDEIRNFDEFTRGEAAKYFCRMLNVSPSKPDSYEALYKDVTSEHRNYAYIKVMHGEHLMIGYPDGRFGPDEPISTMEAATVLARILGYENYIKVQGVNATINKTDLLDGIEISDAIRSDEMYRMLYNTLHTPAVQMKEISNDGATLTTDENYPGIEMLFGMKYGKGIVSGVGNTMLEQSASMHSNQVVINDTVYTYDGEASELLGYNVDYYYTDVASGVKKIEYMAQNQKNRVFILESADIQDYNAFQYKYYNEKGEQKTVSISGDTDVIINGIAYSSFSREDMMPQMGRVTLVDNNGDRAYDVALVDSYEFCIVGRVDAENKVFYDKITNEKFDFSEAVELKITFEGQEYPIERIIQGNLLHIRRSKEASGCYRADIDVRKDERTFVTVESVKGDAFVAGGVEYDLWDKVDADSKSELTIGNAVTLYFFGDTVVRATGSEISGLKYGYLLNVDSEGVIEKTVRFIIVDVDGNATVYEMGNSVKIDGKNCKTSDAVFAALSNGAQKSVAYDSVNYPYAQPVAYALNSQGYIGKIDTAYQGESENEENSFRLDLSGSYTYNGYANGIYSTTWENLATYGNVAVFGIPENNRTDFDKYRAYSMEASESGTKVDVFNIDEESKLAKAVFLYKDFTTESYNYTDPMYLVKDISLELDDEGETVYAVTCIYMQKNLEEVYILPVELASDMGVGDVFRMLTNTQGKIFTKEILFDKSEPLVFADRVIPYRGTSKYDGPLSYGYKFVYGTPIFIKDGYMRMTKSIVSDSDFAVTNTPDNVPIGSAVLYEYSTVRGVPTIEAATQNDIRTYDMYPEDTSEVLLFVYSNNVNFALIINE